jgi:hypothetical protein
VSATTTAAVNPVPLSRFDRWAMAGLAAAVVLLTQASPPDSRLVGHFQDNGIYVLTAKALAEGGGCTPTRRPRCAAYRVGPA